MSIRTRLALWYGALFAGVLLLFGVLTYALHARGHYEDRDRALIASADHAAETAGAADLRLSAAHADLGIALRLYRGGALLETTAGADSAPPLDPAAILAAPSGPAYDALAALAPPVQPLDLPRAGAFGTLPAAGGRWRAYVLPVAHDSFIVALTPLGHLDASMQGFRLSLLALGAAGLGVALSGSMALAERALRPVDRMVATASAIARARDLTQRVPMPPHRDELGRLAETFNTMLASLETAYRAQQRFVSDASHELRAPLTAIQGNLELLRRRPDIPPAERAEVLSEVEREANRLTRLVADLLALARADAGATIRRAPVDLDAVALETLRTARQLAAGQSLVLDPLEPLQVQGDEDRLRQLVLILLDNAIKYTPAGGQVRLGLRERDGQAEITVQDTGVGISAEDLPHIFERFYRADPARGRDPGGTGLGLPIAQWIVAQHGGAIDIQSCPGQGTTVTVRLPLG
ncbi:MAG TPA: ATP-binding protein [Roseiflexaceae bacterium]|nr:ATP-binding protein [Roseiflexaceae bacterium]